VTRVVIDAKILQGFEGMWGRINKNSFSVIAFRDLDGTKKRKHEVEYEEEDEYIRGLSYLGTLHTHTNGSGSQPSVEDWQGINEMNEGHPEKLMGIFSIAIRNSRRYTSVGFWDHKRQLELVIAEN
jgi:hypothetical protein